MDAQDLYGLPLDRFVPERTGLAKELRRSGKREEAEAMAGLRKPSLAAWAVNQLVRTQGRDISALFKAGDAVQRVQADLLAGRGDGPALRDALDRERESVSRLTQVAGGLLSSGGHELSPTILERVSETLHAAALEDEARAQVKDACLHRELRHVGLGAAGLGDGPAPSSPPRPGRRERAPAAAGSAPRREASRRRPQPRPDTGALRKAEAEARRAAARATRDLSRAEARRDAAAEALEHAEADLSEARRRAKEAAEAHRGAAREIETGQRTP